MVMIAGEEEEFSRAAERGDVLTGETEVVD
jgi:hypothetical protein